MQFSFGDIFLEVDVEKTKAFYQKAEKITEGCQCSGCRNYEQAASVFPDEVKLFFRNLGIAPDKAAEVYVNCPEDDGKTVYYGGFYHLCGTVQEGVSPWQTAGNTENALISYWNSEHTYLIVEGYHVGFFNGGSLIEENFPEPVIQMEIEFHVPWVLDEEYSR